MDKSWPTSYSGVRYVGVQCTPELSTNIEKDPKLGGIADRPGDMVDVFHTNFGIAGLSLLGYSGLKEVDPV